MGEAKRRKTAQVEAPFANDREWVIQGISYERMMDALFRLRGGDDSEIATAAIGHTVAKRIKGEDEPMICLLCDHRFVWGREPPGMFIVLRADIPNPKHVAVRLVCQHCRKKPRLRQRVSEAIRADILPGTQGMHEPGHA